jgi:geranylgeranyl pyrophosphate synthase
MDMDLYLELERTYNSLRSVSEWPELETIFNRRVQSHPAHWNLPVTVCLALGGAPQDAVAAVAAVGALQTAILLVDDLLDGDERLVDLCLTHGDVANLASAFQALGFECVFRSQFDPARQHRMVSALNQMVSDTALGQYWDAQNPQDEATYWRVARAKSSPFFRTAFQMGALAAGLYPESERHLVRLGNLYGEMIQIHDDLHDAIEVPANSDWIQMRNPLPILFAQVVDHPQRDRFVQLRRQIGEPGALEEAQSILVQCGAISYCFNELFKRHTAALQTLDEIQIEHPERLAAEFKKLIDPVGSLLGLVMQSDGAASEQVAAANLIQEIV